MFDFFKVSAGVPALSLADPNAISASVKQMIDIADNKKSDVVVFPELTLTGYTVGDLFYQKELHVSVCNAIGEIVKQSAMSETTVVVGAPLVLDSDLYNVAVVVSGGKIRGIVPKTLLANYDEYYEKRWFASADMLSIDTINSSEIIKNSNYEIPVGNNLIFEISGARVGITIGEVCSAPISNSSVLALSGAEVILDLCATEATVSSFDNLENIFKHNSARNLCASVYVSSGRGESTTDSVFFGGVIACENGSVLNTLRNNYVEDVVITVDFDLGKIRNDRCKNNIFSDCKNLYKCFTTSRRVVCNKTESLSIGETYKVSKTPFIPTEQVERVKRCNEIFNIQAEGLRKRLEVTNAKPVIGVSGGLDSTLAILVAVHAMNMLGRPLSDIVGITMPCFGTTDRTKNNAVMLMEKLGVTSVEISIKEACLQHMKDIGQAPDCYDVTFENIQARERTQVLMDYASKVGGLVVGTGDMSELALGWCTYNADHMSMYGVNGGVPKTLVRWMVVSLAERAEFRGCKDILLDIADTPISPELLPPDEKGDIAQQTENIVGPYTLHDFFIFYAIRYGFEPKKIFHLAVKAFEGDFDKATIHKWLRSFYRRFFTQQYKRNCQPDGMKIGSVGISTRSDWKMPSDASFSLWLKAVDEIDY